MRCGRQGVASMNEFSGKIWIYRVECDFCDSTGPFYHVDFSGEPEFYTACMNCIIEKGWRY